MINGYATFRLESPSLNLLMLYYCIDTFSESEKDSDENVSFNSLSVIGPSSLFSSITSVGESSNFDFTSDR